MNDVIFATLARCEELIQLGADRAAAELAMSRLRDITEWMVEVPEPAESEEA